MSRRIALVPVLGLLLAGLGCKHIAGRNDCQWQQEDSILPSPTPPYVAHPATEPKGIPLPSTAAGLKTGDEKPPEKLPEKKPGN